MSKSVLVIETPPCCEDCPCMNWASYEDEILCGVLGEELFVNDKEEVIKSKRCPLKPMPKPKTIGDIEEIIWCDDAETAYGCGWNACIDELEGKEDEIKTR